MKVGEHVNDDDSYRCVTAVPSEGGQLQTESLSEICNSVGTVGSVLFSTPVETKLSRRPWDHREDQWRLSAAKGKSLWFSQTPH